MCMRRAVSFKSLNTMSKTFDSYSKIIFPLSGFYLYIQGEITFMLRKYLGLGPMALSGVRVNGWVSGGMQSSMQVCFGDRVACHTCEFQSKMLTCISISKSSLLMLAIV